MVGYLNDCKSLSFLFNDVLWSVDTALCVAFEKCSVSVYSTHFSYTVWKMLCFCEQYTFFIYCLENILFLCTVHISEVPPGKCSVFVHSTHLSYTVWKVFSFCAQYTFLMYRLESVLFLCTLHISHVLSLKCSVSVHSTLFWRSMMWYLISNRSLVQVCVITASFLFYRGEDSSILCRNM